MERGTSASSAPVVDFGIALHVGDLMYGNIGGNGRLDFTVIGPAVNRVTRMENLCSTWDVPIVTSAEFARLCPGQFESGACALRGIEHPIELFTAV